MQSAQRVQLQENVRTFKAGVVGVAMYKLSMDVPAHLVIPATAAEVKLRNFGIFGNDKTKQNIVKQIVELAYDLDHYVSTTNDHPDLIAVNVNAYFHAISMRIHQLERNSDTQRRLQENFQTATYYRADNSNVQRRLEDLSTQLNLLGNTFDRLSRKENPTAFEAFLCEYYQHEIPRLSETLKDKTALLKQMVNAHIQTEGTDIGFEKELLHYQKMNMLLYVRDSLDVYSIANIEHTQKTPAVNTHMLKIAYLDMQKLCNENGIRFEPITNPTPEQMIQHMIDIYKIIPNDRKSLFKKNKDNFVQAMQHPTADRIKKALDGLDQILNNITSMQKVIQPSDLAELKKQMMQDVSSHSETSSPVAPMPITKKFQ